MFSNPFETLEARTLLAGVTLITHGWNGDITHWIDKMAGDIVTRMATDSGGTAANANDYATRYLLTLRENSQGHAAVQSYGLVAGYKPVSQTKLGEIVLVVDWTTMDTDVAHPVSEIADVIKDFFQHGNADGIRLGELPLHTISQSRGTALLDAIAKSFGQSGMWVDQQTNIDPHPIPEMNDPAPVTYENVAFLDNYWRSDGDPTNGDTDGQPVDGAYNLNTVWVQQNHQGWAHIDMPGYYEATINYSATDDGEAPIETSWFSDGTDPNKPGKNQTGFLYTAFEGGARPLSGVWPASQGTGTRVAIAPVGVQWPNVTDVRLLNEGNTIRTGKTISYRYIHEDTDSLSNITFFLDVDTNPYNNNYARTLRRVNLASASGTVPNRSNGGMPDVAPGTYYIVGRIGDDQGNWRFSYSKAFTVTAPPSSVRSSQSVTNAFGTTPPIDPSMFSNKSIGSAGSSSKDDQSLKTLVA